jgi:tRNA A58 N-methylase Trm61
MTYIIERTEHGIPFGSSYLSITLGNLVFDIVKDHKNTALDNISTFVLDDNNVLVKSDPRIEKQMRPKIESTLDVKIQDLLLG